GSAERADGRLPGRAAVPAAGLRHPHQLPRAPGRAQGTDGRNEFALLIAAALASGTPLALAGLGMLINEKSGVVNLGTEGMMLVAAIAGFATAFNTGSPTLGFLAGAAAGAATAFVFGLLVILLNTNQY